MRKNSNHATTPAFEMRNLPACLSCTNHALSWCIFAADALTSLRRYHHSCIDYFSTILVPTDAVFLSSKLCSWTFQVYFTFLPARRDRPAGIPVTNLCPTTCLTACSTLSPLIKTLRDSNSLHLISAANSAIFYIPYKLYQC